MVFVGLLQALAMWSLASRWIKLSLLYGGLGIAYWMALLCLGKSPADLLHVMPVAAGIAFGVLFLVWLVTMRRHKSAASKADLNLLPPSATLTSCSPVRKICRASVSSCRR